MAAVKKGGSEEAPVGFVIMHVADGIDVDQPMPVTTRSPMESGSAKKAISTFSDPKVIHE
jgi:hypothetical protein